MAFDYFSRVSTFFGGVSGESDKSDRPRTDQTKGNHNLMKTEKND